MNSNSQNALFGCLTILSFLTCIMACMSMVIVGVRQ